MTTNTGQSLLKVCIYACRNPKLTEEEFRKHITTTHAALCQEWLKRHGIVKYTQYLTTEKHRVEAEALGFHTASYDSIGEFTVPSIDCIKNAIRDPFYEAKVAPDEEYIFDSSRTKLVTSGYEFQFIVNGELVVPGSRQK